LLDPGGQKLPTKRYLENYLVINRKELEPQFVIAAGSWRLFNFGAWTPAPQQNADGIDVKSSQSSLRSRTVVPTP